MRTSASLGPGRAAPSPGGRRGPRTASRAAAGRDRRRRARIHSSRSSSIADAGRSTSHSQRPPASPAKTTRSSSVRSTSDVETVQSGTVCAPDADLGGRAGPVRDLQPRVVVQACRRSAHPRPVPGSSLTTTTSTGPSRALVPATQVTVARAPAVRRRPPKSVTSQPGLIGQGRYVGNSPARVRWLGERVVRRLGPGATAAGSARGRGTVQPTDRRAPGPAVGHRGHSVRSGMGQRSRRPAVAVKGLGPTTIGQEFQRSTTGGLALEAEHRDRRGVEAEEPPSATGRSEPARGEHPQGVAVAEDQHAAAASRRPARPPGRAARRPRRPSRRPGVGWLQTRPARARSRGSRRW